MVLNNATHTGIMLGCDARTDKTKYRVQLRETKLFWIRIHGQKFSKRRDGYGIGHMPMYKLDLTSIKKRSVD